MSSTVSSTEIQAIKKVVLAPHKMDDKRLVRTSSLEKIRRFNSFICSQQYYVLPALLAWLRSSQSGLHSSAEKTIFFFRSLLFSHLLYKLYQVEFKSRLTNALLLFQKKLLRVAESQNLLRVAVYATATVLVTELGLCFYLLCQRHIPLGLIFLIVCFFYIIYLNVTSVYFSKRNVVIKKVK